MNTTKLPEAKAALEKELQKLIQEQRQKFYQETGLIINEIEVNIAGSILTSVEITLDL